MFLAEAMGVEVRGLSQEETARSAVSAVRELFGRLSIPETFSEMGIEFTLHPKMVVDAREAPVSRGNPRTAEPEEIASLFLSVQ
jgi:alcohol dehydrogenase class IV